MQGWGTFIASQTQSFLLLHPWSLWFPVKLNNTDIVQVSLQLGMAVGLSSGQRDKTKVPGDKSGNHPGKKLMHTSYSLIFGSWAQRTLDLWQFSGAECHSDLDLPAFRFHLHENGTTFILFRLLLILLSATRKWTSLSLIHIVCGTDTLIWGLASIISSNKSFYGYSMKNLRHIRFHFCNSGFHFYQILRTNLPGSRGILGYSEMHVWILLLTSYLIPENSSWCSVNHVLLFCFLALWHTGALLTLERLSFPERANA